jgi:hypothetical protein
LTEPELFRERRSHVRQVFFLANEQHLKTDKKKIVNLRTLHSTTMSQFYWALAFFLFYYNFNNNEKHEF